MLTRMKRKDQADRIANMPGMRVRPAARSDGEELAALRAALWPESSEEEHLREVDAALANRRSGNLPMEIFVAQDEGGALIGFLEVGLRSHADGCDPAQP